MDPVEIRIDKHKGGYMQITPLTSSEKQIVLGTCLGDSYLGKTSRYYHLNVWHSEKQKDYLQWLWDNLPNLRCSELKSCFVKSTVMPDGNILPQKTSWYFVTKQHPFLSGVKHLLYKKGKKTITRKYLNLMGPQAIAVWWMDDGCCSIRKKDSWKGGFWNTQSFSFKSNKLIQKWFRTIWGIEVKVYIMRNKNCLSPKPYIFLNTTNLKRLIKLIKDYVPECMKYKIDMKYSDPSKYDVDFLPTKTNIKVVEKKV